MGAFRTLGELNACKGDPVAHFSFGLGFFFNAAGAVIGAGALTQDVLHRIVPNWAASFLLVKNKNVEETLQDPAKMGVVGAVIGAITVALPVSYTHLKSWSGWTPGILLWSLSVTQMDMLRIS